MTNFTSLKRKAYPVEKSLPKDAITTAKKLIDNAASQPDIIFFDLPGTLNSKGVVKTLAGMDYIFSPGQRRPGGFGKYLKVCHHAQ